VARREGKRGIMRVDLSDRVILVTGATSGIGAATARRLHAAGAKVIAAGRRTERLTALAEELGARLHPVTLDVRDQAAVAAAIEALPAEFADIYGLVNNAGLARGLNSSDEADLDDWNEMVDANIKGLMYVTRAVLPGMVARGAGHVVNLGSVAGTYPYFGANVYGASKAFVHQFSLDLRADLVEKNIRVTSVEPGAAETEFSLVRFHGDADKADATYKGLDPITADNVADVIDYVLTAPANININRIEIMAAQQGFAGFNFVRRD
jgi:3-hydroxy acid dehydrogenase / malonic semialdehyde reductase